MNAQAEQMKSAVEELMAMVGGSKNGSRRNRQTRVTRAIAVTGRALAAPETKTKVKDMKMAVHHAKEINPEQVIPLDDGDFKDF